jgi:hypothetical protein
LVVTNTNGWELADEMAQWAKLEIFAGFTKVDLEGGDLADNLLRGRELWSILREAIHSGERADTDDEKSSAAWRKNAKKARRKLRKSWRREVPVDPFEFPDISAPELTAWITEGQEPAWAAEAREDDEDNSLS